jgi:hypothetical protein
MWEEMVHHRGHEVHEVELKDSYSEFRSFVSSVLFVVKKISLAV